MADVIKTADQALSSIERYVVLDNTEVATGDVIRVVESIGRSADALTIETSMGSDLTIRVNSKVKVEKRRAYPEQELYGWALTGENNLAQTVEFDSGADSIAIGSASSVVTYQLNDLPIRDVEVTYTTGTFTIMLS